MDHRKIVACTLALSTAFGMAIALTTKFQAAHNSNATLFCNYPHFKMPVTPWQIYWILPNETVIQPWPKAADDPKYHVGYPPAHNLTIRNLNHKEFGWYYCIILWDNYNYFADSVKVGLNIDGALYDDLYEEYKVKAITGSLAAAAVFIILSLSCAIWHYKCRKEEPDPKDLRAAYEFDQAMAKFDQAVDDNETESEIDKDDDEEMEANNIGDVDSVDEKLDDVLDEACGYALVMRNRAYALDGQEDMQLDTIVMDESNQHMICDGMSDATAF